VAEARGTGGGGDSGTGRNKDREGGCHTIPVRGNQCCCVHSLLCYCFFLGLKHFVGSLQNVKKTYMMGISYVPFISTAALRFKFD
jgi:hypothetical protein